MRENCIAGGFLVGFLVGLAVGIIFGCEAVRDMRDDAIKHGVGHYDSQTAEFKWNQPTAEDTDSK